MDSRYFQLEDTCTNALQATCTSEIVVGTYEMAVAVVNAGAETGQYRIDARIRNGQWVQQFNGGAVIGLVLESPEPTGFSAAVDLETGAVEAIPISEALPVLCGCTIVEEESSTTFTPLPPGTRPPTCAEGEVYTEDDNGAAACVV